MLLSNVNENGEEIDANIPDYIEIMRKNMQQNNSKPREGWHVSDVTLCLMQKTFDATMTKEITNKQLHYFTTGRAIHEAIQSLFYANRSRFEREKYVEYNGIEGHVDIYDKRRNIPIEFKTYRSDSISKSMSFHDEQLKYYMAILGSDYGVIIYDLLTHKGDRPWRGFVVMMSEEERKQQLVKLVNRTLSLQNAIKKKNPSMTEGVYDDPELKWLCRDCPYKTECEAIR